jgi:hypothetical protein
VQNGPYVSSLLIRLGNFKGHYFCLFEGTVEPKPLDRNILFYMLVIERLTLSQVAARFGVSIRTVSKYKKVFAIDARLWWKYRKIYCIECQEEIDPLVELGEKARRKLLQQGHVLCDDCKEKLRKRNDRDNKRKMRSENRDEYNRYQRELMRRRRSDGRKDSDNDTTE